MRSFSVNRQNSINGCSLSVGEVSVSQYEPEWTLFVLDDLRAFFDANGNHASADAIVEALRIVRAECSCKGNPETLERAASSLLH